MSDRVLRGGLSRAIFYRTDTGATLSVRGVSVVGGGGQLEPSYDRAPTARGTERIAKKQHRVSLVISDMADVEVLQAWQRKGVQIRALVIGSPRGSHRIWNEPVRIDLQPADAAYGGLAGWLLTLATSRYDAPVTLSDDLNGLALWADDDGNGRADSWQLSVTGAPDVAFVGSGPSAWQSLTAGPGEAALLYRDVVIPAPGLRVRLASLLTGGAAGDVLVDDPGDDATVTVGISAYRFGPVTSASVPLASVTEAITAEGEANAWLTLPEETHTLRLRVRVAGGASGLDTVHIRRPRLFTRPESAENLLNGGFIDRGESLDGAAWVIEEFGSAWVEEATVTRTFRNPITDVSKVYAVTILTLGPGPLLDILSTDHPTEEHTFVLDTYTPPA